MKANIQTASGGQTTAIPTAPTGAFIKPEFIRLPKAGKEDPYFGLKRTALNELILPSEANKNKPPVKSICLRKRGAKRGMRLINYDSLLGYLHGLEERAA